MIPGIISGSSTFRKARMGVHPKSIAASGKALSICCSFGRTCKMTYGVQKATWAISMVKKFRLVDAPNSLPMNTNISISEIPVIISGFVIGISVTVFIAARYHLDLSLLMPTAAKVPITVEITVADAARTSVFFTDSKVFLSRSNSSYHFQEKPEKTDRLLLSLKEKIRSTTIGANKNPKMIALYIFADNFMLLTSVNILGSHIFDDCHAH